MKPRFKDRQNFFRISSSLSLTPPSFAPERRRLPTIRHPQLGGRNRPGVLHHGPSILRVREENRHPRERLRRAPLPRGQQERHGPPEAGELGGGVHPVEGPGVRVLGGGGGRASGTRGLGVPRLVQGGAGSPQEVQALAAGTHAGHQARQHQVVREGEKRQCFTEGLIGGSLWELDRGSYYNLSANWPRGIPI